MRYASNSLTKCKGGDDKGKRLDRKEEVYNISPLE
jgi:hypothetical protein